ncbi:MAG: NAD(P)/FAD-dependent oxidoreductase, partial [Alphaproteobacteria bacterium]
VHPARLHDGLLQAARKAGAVVIPFTRVDGIDETASGVELKTAQGRLAAGEAILATNAYTGAAFPWHHRRIIPVGSYMAATEPVPGATLRRLLPQGRLVNDTRRLAYAVRISPDGRRLLVGGRASARDHAAPRTVARSLHRMLCMTFPELAPVKMTHAWGGMVAFTLDRLPNIGTRGRVHHVLGCNGSGVVMATYLGTITARRLMRANDATTAFARDGLPDHPLYGGRPWFMAPLSAWYGLRDRVDRLADGFRSSPRPGASAR